LRGEQRRGGHHQPHAERENEGDRREREEHPVPRDGERCAKYRIFLGTFDGKRPAKAKGIERSHEQIPRRARRREQPIALLGDVPGRAHRQRVGDAEHGVIERQHRLTALRGRQVEEQRRADRHLHRAGDAHGEAPREQRHRAAHEEKARQHERGDQRGREQQRPPADAVAERAEERRREPAQQVLAQEGEAYRGEADARLAHEIDAEEGDQAHPRGDGDEIRRENDSYSSI